MPLLVVPPPIVAACPFADVAAARAAGDSVGRRASTAGHVLMGIASGFVTGVVLVPAVSGDAPAVKGVAVASLMAVGGNVAVAANRNAPPAAARAAIADCDSTTRAAFTQAFARQAHTRRARRALWSGLGSIVAGVAAIVALVIVALNNEFT